MARYVQQGDKLDVTFGATTASGALISIAGKIGIVDPKSDGSAYESGEMGSATIVGVVELVNSGVVFADGATVGYDESADEAVAGGAGDLDAGTCVGGASATDPVRVLLNG